MARKDTDIEPEHLRPSASAPAISRPLRIAVMVGGALVPLALLGFAPALPDRPPLAHTGGFGEPTCAECHGDGPLNERPGSVSLSGVPWRYDLGTTYRLSVRLVRAGLGNGGFQLSARVAGGSSGGRQAGTLLPTDFRVDVTDSVKANVGRVAYARHTREGSQRVRPDTLQWTVEWKAPMTAVGPVIFHVAANAGNDDDSPLGDYVYITAATSRPGP
jgi:hypothetical protein